MPRRSLWLFRRGRKHVGWHESVSSRLWSSSNFANFCHSPTLDLSGCVWPHSSRAKYLEILMNSIVYIRVLCRLVMASNPGIAEKQILKEGNISPLGSQAASLCCVWTRRLYTRKLELVGIHQFASFLGHQSCQLVIINFHGIFSMCWCGNKNVLRHPSIIWSTVYSASVWRVEYLLPT